MLNFAHQSALVIGAVAALVFAGPVVWLSGAAP